MSEVRIAAEIRTEFGKGGARRTRRAGRVPAVLYGHGQDPRHISLPARELGLALRGGANTLLIIDLDGAKQLALPKAVQRHPIRPVIEHVDLLIVRRGERVTVEIPVTIIGEPAPETLVNHDLVMITVEAEATAIPEGVEVSVEGRTVGESILAADLALPAAVTLLTDPEALVVGFLAAPTAEQLEAELAEAEAEAGIEHEPTDAELEAAAEEEAAGEGAEGAEGEGETADGTDTEGGTAGSGA